MGRARRWRRTQPPAGLGDVPRARSPPRSDRGTQPPRRTVILHLSQPPGRESVREYSSSCIDMRNGNALNAAFSETIQGELYVRELSQLGADAQTLAGPLR